MNIHVYIYIYIWILLCIYIYICIFAHVYIYICNIIYYALDVHVTKFGCAILKSHDICTSLLVWVQWRVGMVYSKMADVCSEGFTVPANEAPKKTKYVNQSALRNWLGFVSWAPNIIYWKTTRFPRLVHLRFGPFDLTAATPSRKQA